jgi:hypothetical protein
MKLVRIIVLPHFHLNFHFTVLNKFAFGYFFKLFKLKIVDIETLTLTLALGWSSIHPNPMIIDAHRLELETAVIGRRCCGR